MIISHKNLKNPKNPKNLNNTKIMVTNKMMTPNPKIVLNLQQVFITWKVMRRMNGLPLLSSILNYSRKNKI